MRVTTAGFEVFPDPELTRTFGSCLPGPPLAGPLVAFRSVASTQEICRGVATQSAPEGTVVLADHQVAGRGRRGRSWTAPPGAALLFSVLLRPPLPSVRWPELTLAAACAVAEGVETAAGVPARLKWPNDVLAGDRKLAGVLAEGVVGPMAFVVLGIGINVLQQAGDWPPDLATRAVSLAELGQAVPRDVLLAVVLGRLATHYQTLLRDGFAPIRDAWRRRAVLDGPVSNPDVAGIAVDLAADGGLIVRRPDGSLTTIVAGEVDVLPSARWEGA